MKTNFVIAFSRSARTNCNTFDEAWDLAVGALGTVDCKKKDIREEVESLGSASVLDTGMLIEHEVVIMTKAFADAHKTEDYTIVESKPVKPKRKSKKFTAQE